MTAVNAPGSPNPFHHSSTSRKRSRARVIATMFTIAALTLALLQQSVSFAQQSGDDATPEASPAGDATPSPDARRLVVDLTEYNDSGVTGTVTFIDADYRTLVDITIENGGEDHPAHIHTGSCGSLDPEPAFELEDVLADGRSRTYIPITLDDLVNGEYAIDLHLAPDDLGTMIACADITGEITSGDVAETTPTATAEGTTKAEPTATSETVAQVPTATVVAGDGTGGTSNTNVGGVGDQIIPTATTAPTEAPADVTVTEAAETEIPVADTETEVAAEPTATATTAPTAVTVAGDGTGTGTANADTSGILGSTGTGPLRMIPESRSEMVIWTMGGFALLLFLSGIWIRRGEQRLATSRQHPRWSRLGM